MTRILAIAGTLAAATLRAVLGDQLVQVLPVYEFHDHERHAGGPVHVVNADDVRVIDGRGRTVVPGLIDTHVHALDVAEAESAQPFQSLQSIDALQAWIRRSAHSRSQTWTWTPRIYPTRLREHRFPTQPELRRLCSSRLAE